MAVVAAELRRELVAVESEAAQLMAELDERRQVEGLRTQLVATYTELAAHWLHSVRRYTRPDQKTSFCACRGHLQNTDATRPSSAKLVVEIYVPLSSRVGASSHPSHLLKYQLIPSEKVALLDEVPAYPQGTQRA